MGQNRRPSGPPEDFDRYHYVDRDIYSDSRGEVRSGQRQRQAAPPPRRQTPPKKKKFSPAKKVVVSICCVLLVLVVAALGIFFVMSSRTNYEGADTSQYEELPESAPAWDVAIDKKVTNILLIGADKNSDGSNGRSDTMMLMSIDARNKKIRLVSFLRDIYFDSIPTVGGERLNAAFAYGGPALTMQTIENYFRINVDRYVQTDFQNFREIIDTMGGIDIEISQAEADYINSSSDHSVTAGLNHLNGKDALWFARIRGLDSDFGRTSRQRQVITAIIEQFKSLGPADMVSVMYNYLPYVTHNIPDGELLQLAGLAAGLSGYEMETMYIPGEGLYYDDYVTIGGIEGNMVLVIDIEANAALLREFLYGETGGEG